MTHSDRSRGGSDKGRSVNNSLSGLSAACPGYPPGLSAPAVPRLTDEIQPIFNTSCALANCHVGDGAGGLNLEAVRAFDELVGVASTEVDDPLVAPGDLEHSYLYEKVNTDTPRVGDRMPGERPRPTRHRSPAPVDRGRRTAVSTARAQ